MVAPLSTLILPPLSPPLPAAVPLPFPPAARRARRSWRRQILCLCGLLSALALSAIPADGLHPLALMAGLLPLQLAGLLWAVVRSA